MQHEESVIMDVFRQENRPLRARHVMQQIDRWELGLRKLKNVSTRLCQLCDEGRLTRVSRGLYRLSTEEELLARRKELEEIRKKKKLEVSENG